eukprot:gene10227-biopygen1042
MEGGEPRGPGAVVEQGRGSLVLMEQRERCTQNMQRIESSTPLCRVGVRAMPRVARSLESVSCHLRISGCGAII